MYHIVEITNSTRFKLIETKDYLQDARDFATKWCVHTGLDIEIQTEYGKVVERIYNREDR